MKTTTINPSIALAKVAKAYLRETKSQTYDMRAFEFSSSGVTCTKVQPLLLAVQFLNLTAEEKEAVEVLRPHTSLENDIEYVKELIRR